MINKTWVFSNKNYRSQSKYVNPLVGADASLGIVLKTSVYRQIHLLKDRMNVKIENIETMHIDNQFNRCKIKFILML